MPTKKTKTKKIKKRSKTEFNILKQIGDLDIYMEILLLTDDMSIKKVTNKLLSIISDNKLDQSRQLLLAAIYDIFEYMSRCDIKPDQHIELCNKIMVQLADVSIESLAKIYNTLDKIKIYYKDTF